MPAFERAVGLGYRYLETDVHVTADGVVVAFHDDDLAAHVRPAGPHLRAAVAGGRDGPGRRPGADPPPRATCSTRGPTPGSTSTARPTAVAEPLADELRRAGALDRVLRRRRSATAACARCAAASVRRCARAPGRSSSAALRFIGVSPRRGAGRAGARSGSGRVTIVNERFVARAHRRGIAVHVWTIDDAAEMRRLLDLGVDGIMTDRPAVLRDVLGGRGQWVTLSADASRTAAAMHATDPPSSDRRTDGGDRRATASMSTAGDDAVPTARPTPPA